MCLGSTPLGVVDLKIVGSEAFPLASHGGRDQPDRPGAPKDRGTCPTSGLLRSRPRPRVRGNRSVKASPAVCCAVHDRHREAGDEDGAAIADDNPVRKRDAHDLVARAEAGNASVEATPRPVLNGEAVDVYDANRGVVVRCRLLSSAAATLLRSCLTRPTTGLLRFALDGHLRLW